MARPSLSYRHLLFFFYMEILLVALELVHWGLGRRLHTLLLLTCMPLMSQLCP